MLPAPSRPRVRTAHAQPAPRRTARRDPRAPGLHRARQGRSELAGRVLLWSFRKWVAGGPRRGLLTHQQSLV